MTKRGRPKGGTNAEKSDWIKICTKVSPESHKYLSALKRRGFMISRFIDALILNHKIKRGMK